MSDKMLKWFVIFASIAIILLSFLKYNSEKFELERYRIDACLGQEKQSIKESHVFYVPEKHQIIVNLPDWAEIIIDTNQKIIDMDEIR